MKIRSTNSSGEFRVPTNIKDKTICHDSKQYCKDVPGVFDLFLVTVQMYFPDDMKFLT